MGTLHRSCDKANILSQVKSDQFQHFTMDANKGGNISDMAVDGTKVPDNAGKPNVIPSVPNPHQQAESQEYQKGRIGAGDIQGAADNAPHMPRLLRGLATRCRRRRQSQSTCRRARRGQRIRNSLQVMRRTYKLVSYNASIGALTSREEVVGSFGRYRFAINDRMTERDMTYDWT